MDARFSPPVRPVHPSPTPDRSPASASWRGTAAVVLLLGWGWLASPTTLGQGSPLVSEDDLWRYHRGFTPPSAPDATAWRQRTFDDAAWLQGRGPFFYEDSAGYTGNTDLTDMRGHYTTLFVRQRFHVARPEALQEVTLNVRVDDGAIVWINGREVARVNMPDGEVPYNATALGASGEPNLLNAVIPDASSFLVAGENVLAVQAANSSLADSSDFLIGVSLTSAIDDLAPTVVDVVPAGGATVRELRLVTVVFSENVQGVDAADLWVNGAPATSLSVTSPREYAFGFTEPAEGQVRFEWATGHGITDLAPVPNAFAGGNWTVTLDKTLPPIQVEISEFLARNDHGIRDEDGDRSDWIELMNPSTETVNLEGWYLTDDVERLGRWRIPGLTIPAKGYVVIWASEKNRTNVFAPLHTNFKLSDNGEYLALVDPKGQVRSAFAPRYPPQQPDISYGRAQGNPEALGYFLTPTPGAANSTSGPGFAPEVQCSLPGGIYTDSTVTVTLTAAAGEIRYTTDGTIPTPSSPRYSQPLRLTKSAVVHARVFQTGLLPGPLLVHVYTLVGNGFQTFSSNLPLLIINTAGRYIPQDNRIPAYVTAIDTYRGRASLQTPPSFVGKGQIEVRGQSSTGFPKLAYNLETDDAFGNDLEVSLLGLPAESDWVLYNPYSDKPFMQNYLAYELHEKMGHYAPRCRFMEVFVCTSNERLDYARDYVGIYILIEKIKVDRNRVDIARLTPQNNTEPAISGGYIIKKDKDSPGDRGFSTTGGSGFSGQYLKYHEPKPAEITPAQEKWIRSYLVAFEKALYAANWLTATGTNHYSYYIDVGSFVDNHWLVEFTKQIDGYRLSNYLHKDRGGKLCMDPVWDWNLSFGNADYLSGEATSGWYYPQLGENDHIWLRRLISGNPSGGAAGDPEFNQAIADRWSVLRTNIFNSTNLLARIDEIAAMLDEAQVRDFKRWPRLGTYVWPNPPIYSQPTTYAGIITNLKNWVRNRYTWVDNQFVRPPTFSPEGGYITPGVRVSLAGSAGTIYYTTDGTDPRAKGGGTASAAWTYAEPILLTRNARIVARLKSGTRWSGPVAATFALETPPLRISEIMYHPAPPPAGDTNDVDAFEFVELWNAGPVPLSLAGFEFIHGIQYQFDGSGLPQLEAGGRVVLVSNRAAFVRRYGDQPRIVGEYVGNLANTGERLTLVGPMREPVQEVRFNDARYPATDGLGFALVAAGNGRGQSAADWRPGAVLGGTPGEAEPQATDLPPILVNEVLARPDPPLVDAVELYNPTDTDVDLGGWYLTDDRREPKYRIPAGTTIRAHSHLVFTEAQFNPVPSQPSGFSFRASGDEVYLYSGDAEGRLTGYAHGFDFGASLPGVSFGRQVNSVGKEEFVAQIRPTLGEANAGPNVGPIAISEVMYHPPDVYVNGDWWDNPEDEYIELVNLSSQPVPLYDPNAPTNTWALRDAVRYAFPPAVTLAAAERVLVVGFNPTNTPVTQAFRARYGLSGATRLFGPFVGKLDNGSGSVELTQPDLVRFDGTNEVVTAVLIDRVAYTDAAPWPAAADGLGFSLQRPVESAYGNDPAHWTAAPPTPGGSFIAGTPPIITQQPASAVAAPGTTLALHVTVEGPGMFSYQWRRDDANLRGATNASLMLTNVQPTQSGVYTVVVSNGSGAVTSQPAAVTVASGPQILQGPQPVNAVAGDRVQLTVVALSSSPMTFQWRKDAQPIPSQTSPTLSLARAQPGDDGQYDVVITDAQATVTSAAVRVQVTAPLPIVQQPLSQTAVPGQTVTLSVAVTNAAVLPIGYAWLKDGVPLVTHVAERYVDFLTLPAVQAADAGAYTVTVTNRTTSAAGTVSEVAQVTVTPVADADGDGLPDAYEVAHGLNPNWAGDATEDADGDGQSNRNESLAGTDPNDPTSVLRIETVEVGTAVHVRFRVVASRTYCLLTSEEPGMSPWQIVTRIPATSGDSLETRVIEVEDGSAAGVTRRYYQLVTPGINE